MRSAVDAEAVIRPDAGNRGAEERVRLSQRIDGMAFVVRAGEIAHAGLIIGDSGHWTLTPPAGHPHGLLATGLRAGLPRLRRMDSLMLTGPQQPDWLATFDRGAERISISAPSAPGFAQDLEMRLSDGEWDALAHTAQLLLLVTTSVPKEPIDDLGALLEGLGSSGLLAGAVIRAAETAPTSDAEDPADTESPRHANFAGPSEIIVMHDPAEFFMELSEFVHDGVMSLEEAKQQARDFAAVSLPGSDNPVLSDDDIRRLFDPRLLAVERPIYIYFLARLLTEVADARGGPDGSDLWAPAVRMTTATGIAALSSDGCQEIFDEVAVLLDRTIGFLRTGGTQAALGSALVDAARLRLALFEPEWASGDQYAVNLLTYHEALRFWRATRERRQRLRPQYGDAKRPLREAAGFAREVLATATGDLRARAACCLLQAATLIDPAEAASAQARTWVIEACEALERHRNPVLWLYLLRLVAEFEPDGARAEATSVFAVPCEDFLGRFEWAVTRSAISQGLTLALRVRDRDLLAAVLSWADQLDEPEPGPFARQVWEARLHAFADDPTGCPLPDADPDTSLRGYRRRAHQERWTAHQRQAAWVHLAAHARSAGRADVGLRLLTEAAPLEDAEDELWPACGVLTADLHYLAATDGTAAQHHLALAAADYAATALYPLACICLAMLQDHLLWPDPHKIQDTIVNVAGIAGHLYAVRDAELGIAFRDLVHATAARALVVGAPFGVHLALHKAAKGVNTASWYGAARPLVLTEAIRLQLDRLHHLDPVWADDAEDRLSDDGESPIAPLPNRKGRGGHTESDMERKLRRHIDGMINDALVDGVMSLPPAELPDAGEQDSLSEDEVVISWLVPQTPGWAGQLIVLAFTRDEVYVTVVATKRDVAQEVKEVRAAVTADPLFRQVIPDGERLLAKVELFLDPQWIRDWKRSGRTRLNVWPHEALHYLPLHLYSHDGRPLVEDFAITTIPALSALRPAIHARRAPRTTVIASSSGGELFGLPREDTLTDHARSVATRLGVAAIVEEDATRERLLAELAVSDIVHIAAHGSQDLVAPWSHCLYLSSAPDDDGRVFAYDVLGTDLRGVRLVTLASCESALGRFDVNDNLRGLPAALLLAGAQVVIGCLWPVDPGPATHFFAALHSHIADGAGIDEAFRQAQSETREQFGQYRHWGSFILFGGSGVRRKGGLDDGH